ncbi:MAG TPA: enoyl-CoA hydratase/isomerase family protein [Terriglobia bacterium]|nr:enoyl-CoA hydratase/isomerase family protein [Terriglobia bacterium]
MYETIIFTTDGPIATIKLNRPDKLNAFGGPMREEILDVLAKIGADDAVRVVIVTGEGRGFSAGGDIDHLKRLRESNDEEGFRQVLANGQRITKTMRSLPKPVIAAVNGPCAGAGFSFALGCDIRIASDAATFGASFSRIGLHPDWGGSWFLPKLVGSASACELIFTGSMISAEEAQRIGLVNRVVPHAELMPTVLELATTVTKSAPRVVRLAKESIYRSLSSDMESAFTREGEVQMECFYSDDFLEGLTAFKEKRRPRFSGR